MQRNVEFYGTFFQGLLFLLMPIFRKKTLEESHYYYYYVLFLLYDMYFLSTSKVLLEILHRHVMIKNIASNDISSFSLFRKLYQLYSMDLRAKRSWTIFRFASKHFSQEKMFKSGQQFVKSNLCNVIINYIETQVAFYGNTSFGTLLARR